SASSVSLRHCVMTLICLCLCWTDKGAILEIPALPVRTGSDVTLHCRERSGDTAAAFFSFNGRHVESDFKSELIITNIQQFHEGFYSCATDKSGTSTQSFLRVRGQSKLAKT
uniref:Ig-like domain-containing protein n=1 Tax=Oreochromis aureus TaxID=47969 RepID=A0AAZ1WX44_OREAU